MGGVVAISPEISPDGYRGAGTPLPGGVVVAAMSFSWLAQPPIAVDVGMVGPAPLTAGGGVAIGDCYGAKRRGRTSW